MKKYQITTIVYFDNGYISRGEERTEEHLLNDNILLKLEKEGKLTEKQVLESRIELEVHDRINRIQTHGFGYFEDIRVDSHHDKEYVHITPKEIKRIVIGIKELDD